MLDVTVFHSLTALAPWRGQLSDLHHASARKSPFTTLEFYEAYLAHDEFLVEGRDFEIWFLIAFEREVPVGYLALRRVEERVGGLKAGKLEFLATHDVEQPHAVCRPEDEARCVEAFYRALLGRGADWSLLELRQQAPGSPLYPPPAIAFESHYLRTFEAMTVSVIHNRYQDFQGYLDALEKKFRGNLKRQLRHLVAAGEVRFLYSAAPQATPPMLELYLALERRSWKARVGGTISRDPRRVAFYRSLLDARMPFRTAIGLVLLDGLPVAGCVAISHQRQTLLPQVVFDDRVARLAPGNLLFALLMREVIDGKSTCLNLMSGFSYYKARWLAQTVECRSVQLFRVGSLLYYKALAGELRRRIAERIRRPAEAAAGNVARRESEQEPSTLEAELGTAVDRRFIGALVANLAARPVRTTAAAEIGALFGLGLAGRAVATRAS